MASKKERGIVMKASFIQIVNFFSSLPFHFMHCLIITTCKDEDEEKIIDALISSKLVACINSFKVSSTYIWKGKIERDEEKLLIIKTRKEKYKEVEMKIRELHSYELPEIICIEIKEGYKEYMKWLDKAIGG